MNIVNENRYLVRPDDSMIFVRTDSGLYQSKDGPTDRFGARAQPYSHFTYNNLVNHFGFRPITEEEVSLYEQKHKEYYRNLSNAIKELHY